MTDQTTLTESTESAPPTDPAERGRTVIGEAVFEHIAMHAALEVSGVAQSGSGLDKVIGRRYPKADAQVAGTRARLHVEIAVVWPYPLAEVTSRVRDTVSARLNEMTGMTIDAVDVTAATVVHEQPPTTRRVQ